MKYVLYARKSSESEERQALSVEAQIAELCEFAAKERLEIVASLCEAKTAKEPGRTVFGEMLDMIEQGKADSILAWHPDRLARNSVDGGRIIHMLDTGKLKDLRFPTMTFENTPQGKFMLSIAFSQSKYYVDNLSENVKRGIRQKLRRGEWPTLAPVGYINNPKTRNIQPDPEKAPLVRKAFELYVTGGHTLCSLRKAIFELGLSNLNGKPLPVSGIQQMLNNHIYYGMMRVNGELFPGCYEPIVSKDLFDEVQLVMAGRAKKQHNRKHDFPFIGFIHCASCGCAITAEKQKGHHYYRCTKKRGKCEERKYLREESLLEQAKKIVEQVSLPDEWAEKMLQKLNTEKTEQKIEIRVAVQHHRKEKREIEGKLSELLNLRLEGVLDTPEYIAKKNSLTSRKLQIEQKIKDAERGENDWLEPMREIILRSRDAKILLSKGKPEEYPTFLRNVGSNFLLKRNALRWEPRAGWRILAKSARFSTWSG
jgi:site-specific DNA recombinase